MPNIIAEQDLLFLTVYQVLYLTRGAVYRTVAKNGSLKELETLQNRFRSAERAEERQMLLYAIVTIGDYHLMQQVLGGFLPHIASTVYLWMSDWCSVLQGTVS
jgi:hypothetical protein